MATAHRKTQKRVRHWNNYGLMLIPGFILLLLGIGGTLFWNAQISFTRWKGYDQPVWAGLKNYRFIFMNDDFQTATLHALWFVIPFALLPTLVGALSAAFIADFVMPKFGQAPSSFLRSTIYLPQVVPVSISGLIWLAILDKSGALNILLSNAGHESWTRDWFGEALSAQVWVSIIIFWMQVGYTTTVILAGTSRIDTSLYEAAALDGANWFQRFRAVTIPQLRPELFVVMLVSTIGALKIFAPIYFTTGGGPMGATTTPSLFAFDSIYGFEQVPFGAAVSTTFTIIVGFLAYFIVRIQHRYVEDTTS